MKNLDVIIASSDAGVHVNGSSNGAIKLSNDINYKSILKQKEFIKSLDKNDLYKNLNEVNDFNTKLYNEVYDSLEKGSKVLTIGGDHVVAIGSALASIKKHKNMGIIWIDAHGDYNTFDTTVSGNLHGLPLAVIDGYEKNKLNIFHDGNYYNPKNTVIVGGRDIEPKELINLKDAGVTIYSTKDIKSLGIEKVISEAFNIARENTNCVHISYDVDVIDPNVAKGVSIPAKDGISENDAYLIMDEVLKYKNIINSFDLVEYNSLTDDGKTFDIVKNLRDKIINNL